MNTIDVNLHVNISLNDDVKSFLTGLFGGNKQEQPTQQAPAAKPAQPTPAPKPAAKPAPAPKPAAKPEEKPAKSNYTIEDVRALLMKKVNDHRSEIKEKLSELGSNSVTNLDPEKYQEFVDYLNSL